MAPSGSHWHHRVGVRHLRFLNLSLQHHHSGPHEDPDCWKHRTLRRRVRLGWLRRLSGMQVGHIKPLRLWSRCVGHSPKELDEKVAELHFQVLSTELFSFSGFSGFFGFFRVPGSPGRWKIHAESSAHPCAGSPPHRISTLSAHQMAVPGQRRTENPR